MDCTPEFGFHVINLDGSLYLTSAEVSSLFWEEDILAAMVRQISIHFGVWWKPRKGLELYRSTLSVKSTVIWRVLSCCCSLYNVYQYILFYYLSCCTVCPVLFYSAVCSIAVLISVLCSSFFIVFFTTWHLILLCVFCYTWLYFVYCYCIVVSLSCSIALYTLVL